MLVRCCVSGPQGIRAARREQSTCPRRQNLLFRADAANAPLGTVAEACRGTADRASGAQPGGPATHSISSRSQSACVDPRGSKFALNFILLYLPNLENFLRPTFFLNGVVTLEVHTSSLGSHGAAARCPARSQTRCPSGYPSAFGAIGGTYPLCNCISTRGGTDAETARHTQRQPATACDATLVKERHCLPER